MGVVFHAGILFSDRVLHGFQKKIHAISCSRNKDSDIAGGGHQLWLNHCRIYFMGRERAMDCEDHSEEFSTDMRGRMVYPFVILGPVGCVEACKIETSREHACDFICDALRRSGIVRLFSLDSGDMVV